jgi:uncharacterized protein YfaS (alpha-2-macroglobulin family)
LVAERERYDKRVRDAFFSALEHRLAVDARGAYVKDGARRSWSLYETTEKTTGMFMAIVALRDPEYPLAGNMLRWLLARRDRQNVWGSTNATFAVLDGALAFALARNEATPDFELSLSVLGAPAGKKEYTAASVFDTFDVHMPLSTLPRETVIPIVLTKDERGRQGQSAYYDLVVRYALPPEYQPPRDEGITVERTLYRLEASTTPTTRARVGDIVRGSLTITVPEEYHAVSIEDFIPAGFELVNTRLATEALPVEEGSGRGAWGEVSPYNNAGMDGAVDPTPNYPLTPDFEELRDDRVFAFREYLAPGVYTYEYHLRALVPGTFKHLPATVSEMYFPEVFGRTAGGVFTVEE